jgi:hypothetical protein
VDDLKEMRGYSIALCRELVWRRLWICHKTDCGMNEWQNDYENLNT